MWEAEGGADGGDSRGTCQEPEHGQMGDPQYATALADRRRSTAHEDNSAALLRTVPRCN